jgi:redox-sensitive bicupin YhaK (pirin superfamily)
MEIITYVVSGAVAHRDSLGNTETIGAHGIQKFSAGTGIAHSEFNPSATEPLHLLQIWILPDQQGLPPSYEQAVFAPETKQGKWRRLASRDASDGAARINQNAELYATILQPGTAITYALKPGRHAWVQVVKGSLTLNGKILDRGDGAAISDETDLTLEADAETEVLLFDLA